MSIAPGFHIADISLVLLMVVAEVQVDLTHGWKKMPKETY